MAAIRFHNWKRRPISLASAPEVILRRQAAAFYVWPVNLGKCVFGKMWVYPISAREWWGEALPDDQSEGPVEN